jgi:hypothetical protein
MPRTRTKYVPDGADDEKLVPVSDYEHALP